MSSSNLAKSRSDIISVVIPCYYSSEYICDAIESVLNQTFYHCIKEIILIDDGSEDDTKKVINKYVEKGLIKYFYQENQGPASARNNGIRKSSGKYIAFLDSDDVWKEEKIEEEIDYLLNDKYKLLFSNVIVVDEDLNKIQKNFNEVPSSKEDFIREVFFGNITMNTPTIIVEKKAVTEIGGFCEDLPHKEDHFFLMEMARNYKIKHLSTFNVLRRIRESSMSQSQLNNLQDPIDHIRIYKPFLNKSLENFPELESYEKEILSKIYTGVAVKFLRAGKRMRSWQYLLYSVINYPLNIKNYFLFFASLIPIKYEKLKKHLLRR